MAEEQDFVSISDATVPNAGRIYDYLLGGNHNFEVDRVAAEKLKKVFPKFSEDLRLIRWFLGAAVRRLCEEGFRRFLDFASGLPTVDHIHHVAPKDSRVVYSDIDPVTVSYGQEIVRDLSDVAYVHGDARTPETILQMEVVQELMGSGEKIAIGFSGIAYFLPDDAISHALQVLYDWAQPGSRLFISDVFTSKPTETGAKVTDFYKNLNQPVFLRTEEQARKLYGSWTVSEADLRPLEQWVELSPNYRQETTVPDAGTLMGAILQKT